MMQANTLLDSTWNNLVLTMETMLGFQSITTHVFLSHYNSVQQYFNSPEYQDALIRESLAMSPPAAGASQNNSNQSNEDHVESNIPGGQMYFNIKQLLRQHLNCLAKNDNSLQDEEYLRYYAKTWEQYQFISKILDRIFACMNSNWISRQRKSGHKHIYEIFNLAMNIWKQTFFEQSTQSLTKTCFSLIRKERNGEHIDVLLIKNVVLSYVSIGAVETEKIYTHNRLSTLQIYKDHFESEFLQNTEEFYRLELATRLANCSPLDYMKKVLKRVEEEDNRIITYLHETTRPALCDLVHKILITEQLDAIYIESKRLIPIENIEDLSLLFNVVSRIPRANAPIEEHFEKHVYEVAMNAMNGVSDTALADPKLYIDKIVEVYNRFKNIIEKAFRLEPSYIAALDRAFSRFVNDNAVARKLDRPRKSPELLARYCDILLRKGDKATANSDVDEKLSEIMIVFNYIEDKDVFQKFYGTLLAKRLIGQLSASDDYEETMISKLKAACGYEYASKLQRMFQDIRLSATLTEEYRTLRGNQRLNDLGDVSVTALSSNSWPFSPSPPFILPTVLSSNLDHFTCFYLTKYNGRKLEWLHQHSKCELKAFYTQPAYTFQVSVYQTTILLMFNESTSLLVEKMLDKTGINRDIFLSTLFSLLQSKVLICSEIDDKDLKETNIQMNYTIQLATGFKSKRVRINLNQPTKAVEQKETETVNQAVDEERKILIKAAIVRIMKARKTLKHSLLIQEVIPQLTARFKPEIPKIKKCIDVLMETGYIERDATDRDTYHYLA